VAIAKQERDLEAVRGGLERWLRARRPETANLHVAPLSRPPAGLSSETLFADATWTEAGEEHCEQFVARLPPAGEGLFPRYDLTLQARLQELMGPAGIPVATPIALEPDEAWVGAPFLLMPRVPGRVLVSNPPFVQEGWLHDAPPADQARLHEGFFDVLARIHRLDWEVLDLGFAARPGSTPLSAELQWWSGYLGWASDGAPLPVLADALVWCHEHRPDPEPPPSLLWGDVQLVNAVFDDELGLAAVLDWEMASIGPAEMDLGWFLALHRMTVDTVGGDLPGFPDRAATIGCYERRLGRELADVRWFEALALVRSGAIMVRVARLLAEIGVDDSWLTKDNPALRLLARLVDSEEP
jgi:aminoglycoside phosphotransferase (APT) family kinase protein